MLIVKIDMGTVSIFKNGKILVRGEKDETNARNTAEKVVSVLKESAVEKKGLFG